MMNLPVDFKNRTIALLGEADFLKLEAALQIESPVSIRLNRAKANLSLIENAYEPVPWCSDGYYLKSRPSFTFDPFFHLGCYYVQEASSMFLAQVLRMYVKEPVKMLDLCAAPGGKSTLARAFLPEGSLLVANEVMRNRSQILAENLIKWGHPDTIVTNNAPADFMALPAFFDVMLTDVPCSGEGMFRKDAIAIADWSTDNVNVCWQRQRQILVDAWTALKPGGLLIYSTCTYNREENEDNVQWIVRELGAELLEVPVERRWQITGSCTDVSMPVYRFLPYKTKGEGLFMAVLRKTKEESKSYLKTQNVDKRRKSANPIVPKEVKQWVKYTDSVTFVVEKSNIMAYHTSFADDMDVLSRNFRVLHAGMVMGAMKGKDVIPSQSLAMSILLKKDAFSCVELTYKQAIAFLRKEAIALEPSIPRGYILLMYKGYPLGFVKNVGNRANNLYPNEWRIRSGYLPEEPLFVWQH